MFEGLYKKILFLTCVMTMSMSLSSQTWAPYFLNTSNGLPSDHVYYTLTDKLGYLWIASNKGVLKYNGYDLKTFNAEDGISNEDVWMLYEDRKGRMWLLCISNEMGYIKNDKYHKTVSNMPSLTSYPGDISEHREGLIFNTLGPGRSAIGVEKNDSIRYSLLTLETPHFWKGSVYADGSRSIYKLKLEGNGTITTHKIGELLYPSNHMRNNLLIPKYYKSDGIEPLRLLNAETLDIVKIPLLQDEAVYMSYPLNDNLYLTSTKHIYKLSKDGYLSTENMVDTILKYNILKPGDAIIHRHDSLWGDITTSVSSGLLLNIRPSQFRKIDSATNKIKEIRAPSGYVYHLDVTGRSVSFQDPYVNSKRPIVINRALNLRQYSNDSFLLFRESGVDWLVNGRISRFFDGTSTATNAYVKNSCEIYFCSPGIGLTKMKIKYSPLATIEKVTLKHIDYHRYSEIIFDSTKNIVIAYGRSSIHLSNGVKHLTLQTNRFGIEISKMFVDNRYGNIIIQSNEKIRAFNFKNFTFHELYKDINLRQSHVFLQDNRLIVVGKFGILCSKINGYLNFSKPHFIYNFKKANYGTIKNVFTHGNNLQLDTDKGILSVDIPSDSNLKSEYAGDKYKLVIKYEDSSHNYSEDEILRVTQFNTNIQFDLINPFGAGKVKYKYFIEGNSIDWSYLTNNELNLPSLTVNRYYKLYIQANDELIRTRVYPMEIYIIPYWWQTQSGEYIIGAGILTLLILIIAFAMQLTKRRLMVRNAENNLKLEVRNLNLALELKSIYAQINPHFIFNTLNTGLYFIKKKRVEEAYTHITSFSQLLRSYLKSSRNKYITLKEEVVNLQNYISLQQARFDNKFTYNIITSTHSESIKIPTLLLQPIVENAINHGLLHKKGIGELILEFHHDKDKNKLTCIIDDNGIGRAKAKAIRLQSELTTPSYGSDLVKELITTFNKYESVNINIEYIDKQPPLEGTRVVITIQSLSNDEK